MGNIISRLRSKDYLMDSNNTTKNDKSLKKKSKETFYRNFYDIIRRKIGDSFNIRTKRIITRNRSDNFLSSYDLETNNFKVKKNKSIDNICDLYSISPLSRHSSMRKTKSLDCLKLLCQP